MASYDMTVMPGTEEGPYVCSSIGSSTSPDDEDVDDPSQDGGDHPDLLLMALLLSVAAMRRLRG